MPYSPQTRATLNAANAAIAAGDNNTASQLIQAAYDGGNDEDRARIAIAALTLAADRDHR